MVFDLDHFKAINDNYGHQTGDRVLEEFSRVVSSTLRDTDIFGRLGGEEFGVVLLQTDREGAKLLAERLRIAVEKMRVVSEGSLIEVTVSIGGTQWERHDRKIEVIMNRADNALYEAKRRGRNQVCFRFATTCRDEN
ncbi:MAG: GGDEF protein [uncultured bacterium]|nr:MAG: GGDEF protein [uncultured bacterium]